MDDSGEKRRRGETGREGSRSGDASVPLRPATSYHGASADRWMQESPIIEILEHKRPDEGEGLPLWADAWGSRGEPEVSRRDDSYPSHSAAGSLLQVWFIFQQDWETFCFHRACLRTVTMDTFSLDLSSNILAINPLFFKVPLHCF